MAKDKPLPCNTCIVNKVCRDTCSNYLKWLMYLMSVNKAQ